MFGWMSGRNAAPPAPTNNAIHYDTSRLVEVESISSTQTSPRSAPVSGEKHSPSSPRTEPSDIVEDPKFPTDDKAAPVVPLVEISHDREGNGGDLFTNDFQTDDVDTRQPQSTVEGRKESSPLSDAPMASWISVHAPSPTVGVVTNDIKEPPSTGLASSTQQADSSAFVVINTNETIVRAKKEMEEKKNRDANQIKLNQQAILAVLRDEVNRRDKLLISEVIQTEEGMRRMNETLENASAKVINYLLAQEQEAARIAQEQELVNLIQDETEARLKIIRSHIDEGQQGYRRIIETLWHKGLSLEKKRFLLTKDIIISRRQWLANVGAQRVAPEEVVEKEVVQEEIAEKADSSAHQGILVDKEAERQAKVDAQRLEEQAREAARKKIEEMERRSIEEEKRAQAMAEEIYQIPLQGNRSENTSTSDPIKVGNVSSPLYERSPKPRDLPEYKYPPPNAEEELPVYHREASDADHKARQCEQDRAYAEQLRWELDTKEQLERDRALAVNLRNSEDKQLARSASDVAQQTRQCELDRAYAEQLRQQSAKEQLERDKALAANLRISEDAQLARSLAQQDEQFERDRMMAAELKKKDMEEQQRIREEAQRKAARESPSGRLCQCLGASAGFHKKDCPLNSQRPQ